MFFPVSWHLAPLHSTAGSVVRSILSTHLSEAEIMGNGHLTAVYPYIYIHVYVSYVIWYMYSYSIWNRFKPVQSVHGYIHNYCIFLPYLPLLGKFSTMVRFCSAAPTSHQANFMFPHYEMLFGGSSNNWFTNRNLVSGFNAWKILVKLSWIISPGRVKI